MQTLSTIRNLFIAMMAMFTMAFAGTVAADNTSDAAAMQDQTQATQTAYNAGGGDDSEDDNDDWNQSGDDDWGDGDDGEDDDGGGDW